MKIRVTGVHIKAWKRANTLACPVALALKERGVSGAKVGYYTIRLSNRIIALPDKAQAFIENFDEGKKVKPFSFEINYEGELYT